MPLWSRENQPVFHAEELEKQLRAKPVHQAIYGVQEACGRRVASRTLEGGRHDIVKLDDNYQVAGVLMNDDMMDNRMHVYNAEPCPTKPGVYAIMGVKHGAPRCCAGRGRRARTSLRTIMTASSALQA